MDIAAKVKKVCQMAKDAGNTELYAELLDLREALLEMNTQDLSDMQFREGAYYRPDDEIPYCPHCKEVHNQAIHLSCLYENERGLYDSDPAGKGWQWQCLHCKNELRLAHGK